MLAADYQPVWVASLADEVTLEGSAMNGVVRGAETVRSILTYIRTLYDDQVFILAVLKYCSLVRSTRQC
ncbi:MAG TPA: hypothetical protein VEH31_31360 [Streptosporangiaceae bacterium]|nr:hypothetical protein [Streptosporangiaceae bacterium]